LGDAEDGAMTGRSQPTWRRLLTSFTVVATAVSCLGPQPQGDARKDTPLNLGYIADTISVPEDEERIVVGLYDCFINLRGGGSIPAGAEFPSDERFCTHTETYATFCWSWYIAPNELRGFEISIPRRLLLNDTAGYRTTAPLVVNETGQRQSIMVFVMTEAGR
jgi:hypothetical protein